MNLFFAQAAVSTTEALLSYYPFVFLLIFFAIAAVQIRRNKKYTETSLRTAKETQELQKETIALLKEISAKLNK